MTRRVCVVGGGGREHALAHALARSAAVVVTPGSDAIAASGVEVTDAPATAVDADLFVIGPEQPLVDGLADRLRERGRLVVGPGRDGAALEGSKAFMKGVLTAAGVPTARYGAFEDADEAIAFLRDLGGTVVVKTDGLAAGKGVLVTEDLDLAAADVRAKLSGSSFGAAGRRVVVEEGLVGEECTVLVLVDGTTCVPLAPSRDHKRLLDDDLGPNTGGMGAVSPPERVDDELVAAVLRDAVRPTVAELAARGIEYRGVLYAGVMVTADGPKLLEFNVRMGDPESQVVLPRLADDPYDLFEAVASGTLGTAAPRVRDAAAVTVVMAAAGYPDHPVAGAVIRGLDAAGQPIGAGPGVHAYHAGTRLGPSGYEVAGGRVLAVTALDSSVAGARALAYDAVGRIEFEGAQIRRDVAASTKVST